MSGIESQLHEIRGMFVTGVALILVLISQSIAQPVLKDRRKDFGKSLEKRSAEVKSKSPLFSSKPIDNEIIRVETNLVITDILVLNAKGNAIVGLKKEDFIVTENGIRQEMEMFSAGKASIPKTIVLIVEAGGIPAFTRRSLDASKTLVDKLGSDDKMAIVTDDVKLVVDFTSDKGQLRSALESLKAKQRNVSRSLTALTATLNELFTGEDMRPIVVLQAHGEEMLMFRDGRQQERCKNDGPCENNVSFAAVMRNVERSRATIYTIVPVPRIIGLPKPEQLAQARIELDAMLGNVTRRGSPELRKKLEEIHADEDNFIQTGLVQIANLSGGYIDFIDKPENVNDIYDSIFKVIENRYVLGYYPKNQTRDRGRRTVKIGVKDHPEYMVIGRKTYFAPEP